MGRPSQGFRLKPQSGTDILAVAWWDEQQQRDVQRSTGERDRTKAARRGAEIWAAAQRGERSATRYTPRLAQDDLVGLGGRWLTERRGQIRDCTIACYLEYFEGSLGPFFGSMSAVNPDKVRAYVVQELARTEASTVRKKLSCLRGLASWALRLTSGEAMAMIPGVPKTQRGKRYHLRRRGKATQLSTQEVARFLAALPEWSRKRKGSWWPIRSRFILAYETSLRPATLSALSVPEHWAPGATSLIITDEIDKARFGREVPLTPAALAALNTAFTLIKSHGCGLLFGSHDYRDSVRAAARAAGIISHRVATLCPYDLRHARLTHLCAVTKNLTGVMALAGHKHLSTTATYVHADSAAARAMLQEVTGSALIAVPFGLTFNASASAVADASSAVKLVAPSTAQLPAVVVPHDPEDEPHGFG